MFLVYLERDALAPVSWQIPKMEFECAAAYHHEPCVNSASFQWLALQARSEYVEAAVSAILNSVFALHRRSLLSTVMRIVRDPHTAEDLTQETYVRAKKAFDDGEVEHPEGFLHQTARNLALDHLRRTGSRNVVESVGLDDNVTENVASDVVLIETEIIERQKFTAFERALHDLPARAQTVLILARIERWAHYRIAEHLGVSERTVFNDLKLAMAHCRDAVTRHEKN